VGITRGSTAGVGSSPQDPGGNGLSDEELKAIVNQHNQHGFRDDGLVAMIDESDIVFFVAGEIVVVSAVKGGGFLIKTCSSYARAAGETIAESKLGGLATRAGKAVYELFHGAGTLQKTAAKEVGYKVGDYTLEYGAYKHLNDVNKLGVFDRPFLRSPNTIGEIISTGKSVPDPRGMANVIRYDVPGTFRGSQGTWELVVEPTTKTIYHFNFTTGN
jgi:hypothetical protein